VYTYKDILVSNKREESPETRNNLDESGIVLSERSEPQQASYYVCSARVTL
jgi:hypothetical protein